MDEQFEQDQVVVQRIRCPFCNEAMEVLIDVSAGGQAYIEDCQVCCQPMQISFDTLEGTLSNVSIERAS